MGSAVHVNDVQTIRHSRPRRYELADMVEAWRTMKELASHFGNVEVTEDGENSSIQSGPSYCLTCEQTVPTWRRLTAHTNAGVGGDLEPIRAERRISARRGAAKSCSRLCVSSAKRLSLRLGNLKVSMKPMSSRCHRVVAASNYPDVQTARLQEANSRLHYSRGGDGISHD